MATPPTHDSIRITKSMTYRGVTAHLWTNRYYLRDPVIAGNRTLALDGVVAAEELIYGTDQEIVKGEYLVAGSDIPATEKTYTTPGGLPATGTFLCPGDCATVIRYATTQRTSKNHPIYLFNYYHGARVDPIVGDDAVAPAQLTALNTYGNHWVQGLTYGGGLGVLVRCGPHGAVAQSRLVEPWIGHRDFT